MQQTGDAELAVDTFVAGAQVVNLALWAGIGAVVAGQRGAIIGAVASIAWGYYQRGRPDYQTFRSAAIQAWQ